MGGLRITGTAAVVGAIGDAFSGLFGGGDPPPKAPPVGANGDGGVTAGPLGSDPRSNVDPSTLSVPIWAWQPAEWDSSVSYGQGDAVLRNGAWFKSTGNSNRGHDPANGQTDGQDGYNAGPPWWGLYVAQRAP